MLRTRLAACALSLLCACDDDDAALSPLDGSVDASLDAGPPPLTADERASLDVLFVIDNSGAMGEEQYALAREIPWFLEQLAQRTRSLHVGVVTTNLGGIDQFPANAREAVRTCAGAGDDGLLQRSTDAARDGYTRYPGFNEFGEPVVLLPADPACALGAQPAYQDFTAGGSALAVSCMARPGVFGCPFEQQLEAMWKALAPGGKRLDPLYEFVTADGGRSEGQGDRGNQGFLRDNAALAVIVLSDEEDCSVSPDGLGLISLTEEAEQTYGNLNLRCGKHADLLQPIARYAQALRSLKAHPDRIVFTAIAGIPAAAVTQRLEPAAILALPEMQFREDPQNPTFPASVCELNDGQRWPGRRYVELAQALGDQAVLGTLCADDYRGALERTLAKLTPLLQ